MAEGGRTSFDDEAEEATRASSSGIWMRSLPSSFCELLMISYAAFIRMSAFVGSDSLVPTLRPRCDVRRESATR